MTQPAEFSRAAEELAERATLGALLAEPTALGAVSRWLRAADFADPWHSALYTVLREQHTAHRPTTAQAVGAALVDRLGGRQANLPALADLIHAAPTRPDPVRYGRMVLETGLRREVTAQGLLLRAGALRAALTGLGQPMATGCDLVDAALAGAGRRWAAASGQPLPADTTPVPMRATLRSTEVRLGADKLLRLHPPRDPGVEREHEVALIAALVAHPDTLSAVAGWLPPTRVGDPAWRTVYATAVELADLGETVDVVTITWALRRTTHHGAPTPDPGDLAGAVDAARFTPPSIAARAVAGDQLRRLADIGATQLTAAATNPGVLVPDLVDTGHLLTGALRHVATALPATPVTAAEHLADVHELRATRGPVAG